jgi:glycosyltransferase involved in cell wall biosynthesis
MFVDLPAAQMSDPAALSVPVGQKVQQLHRHRRRCAWLYENPDTSTFRYRVLNMIEAVNAPADRPLAVSWFSAGELAELEQEIEHLSVLVVARYRYSMRLHQLVMKARHYGVRVLFESDDLVFDPKYIPLIADTLAQDLGSLQMWDQWFAYIGRLGAAARLCEGGISTNAFLAQRLQTTLGGGSVAVVPNFLNRRQQSFSAELLEAKRRGGWRRDGHVTIGYFSGSPTHRKDFAVAAPALARLLDHDPRVRVRVAGYLDSTGPLQRHADRVEVMPHMDYVALQRAIAEVEINIAPLQDNVFTNCKSELKFFEAAVVGTWTIATPTYTFERAIDDPRMGRLARAHEWDDALAEAMDLVHAPQAYMERAEFAAEQVVRRYGWDQWGNEIEAALFGRGA